MLFKIKSYGKVFNRLHIRFALKFVVHRRTVNSLNSDPAFQWMKNNRMGTIDNVNMRLIARFSTAELGIYRPEIRFDNTTNKIHVIYCEKGR